MPDKCGVDQILEILDQEIKRRDSDMEQMLAEHEDGKASMLTVQRLSVGGDVLRHVRSRIREEVMYE